MRNDNYSSQIKIIYLIVFCLMFQLSISVWVKIDFDNKTSSEERYEVSQKTLEKKYLSKNYLTT